MTDTPILLTRDLAVGYDSRDPLLRQVNLAMYPGELVSLLGANGRGKSTLLRTLTGEQKPVAGTVTIDGLDIRHIPARRRAHLVSIVNTDRTAGAGLTVEQLVSMGRYPYTGYFGRLTDDDRRIVADAIAMTGLTVGLTRKMETLSDGERQKALIARAIAQQTPVIVLDEPTAFLDAAARIEMMQTLATLAHTPVSPANASSASESVGQQASEPAGRLVILSTHDIAPAVRLSDRLLLAMPDGAILDDTPATLAANPGALPSLFTDRPVRYDPPTATFIPSAH